MPNPVGCSGLLIFAMDKRDTKALRGEIRYLESVPVADRNEDDMERLTVLRAELFRRSELEIARNNFNSCSRWWPADLG